MTDLDRYLTDELIEKALREFAQPRMTSNMSLDGPRAKLAAALTAALPAIIQQAKAEAWGEGHAAGCADPYAKYGECGCGPNPYRADRIEQGGQP